MVNAAWGRYARSVRRALLASVTAIALVVVAALLLAPGGQSSTFAKARAACGDRGWPSVVSGRGVRSLRGRAARYAVSQRAGAWRLAANASAGRVIEGRLRANRAIHLIRRASWVHVRGTRLTFRVKSTGRLRVASFRAPCATRLDVAFAASTPRAVSLGTGRAAPATTFAVLRPAGTGVEGSVLRGPTCPVESPTRPCPPAPAVQTNVRIDTAPPVKGQAGSYVTTVTTDADGRFSASLPPGSYMLTPEAGPSSTPAVVDVAGGILSDVTLVVDSGIR